MSSSYPDIISLIPQRPPFVMVDSLIHADEAVTHTRSIVAPDNILVDKGHFSAAGLLENMAQTAAARAGNAAILNGGVVRKGYIGAVKNFTVSALPPVGSTLDTMVEVMNQIFDVTLIKGRVEMDGKVLASCEMKIFIAPQ